MSMHSAKKHESDMTSGNVWKQIIGFALPLMVGLLFQQLYNTVDTIVVGRFVGKEALAAVGSTGSLINVMVSLGSGLAGGATILVSQYFGAHDGTRLSNAVQTTMVLTFLVGILSTVAGLFLVDPLLHFMSTPDDVYASSKQYVTIYFSGLMGLFIYNMGSGVLRAVGDSKRPLFFLIFSACMNIVLDLFFVLVFHMGVAGVGYATILSQFFSGILTLIVLTRTKEAYGIRWKQLRIHRPELKQVLSLGLPTSIQQGVTSFSNVFVQGYINILGSTCMAGWSAYGKLDAMALLPMQAIAMASSTFVGQNYGARLYKRARQGANVSFLLCEIVTIFLGGLVMIFAPQCMLLFTKEPDIIEYAVLFVRLITPFYMAMCVNQIYSGALRGIGRTVITTVIMLFSFVLFRQAYLFVNKLLFAGTETYTYGIAFAYPMGWLLCSVLTIIVYRRSVLFKGES